MHSSEQHAVCRRCGSVLKGKPYFMGGPAYHPRTNERCPTNHYGGFVCSPECDYRASLELEQTMPGHGYGQTSISQSALNSYHRNWRHLSHA